MQYMALSGWLQFLVFLVVLAAITKPMGIYLLRVLDPDKEGGLGLLEKIFAPVEWLVYKLARINPKKQQNWKQYALSLLMLGMVTTVLSYGLYRIQDILPLKDNLKSLGATVDENGVINGGGKVPAIIAFIQAVAFSTNTDWQSYEPEQMFTHFSQIVTTMLHFFFSSAVGIAAAAALVRGVARQQTRNIGNFWVDLTRIALYLFIPICLVYALVSVWQGMPMNYREYTQATTLEQPAAASPAEPMKQPIVQGPIAAFSGPKVLGLNGPGITGADTAHPFENPTPLSEFIQLIVFFSIVAGLPYYYGRMINHTLHGWNIWLVMFGLLIVTNLITWYFEAQPNPRMTALGVSPVNCNMEGKEVRIGIYNSATWANNVTITAEGANNCQHDSMMPLAGFMLMFNMHMGEVIFGGIGTGLYSMLVFIFVSVFLAGLMIGRTPDYLGKKINSFDVKCCCLLLLMIVLDTVGFTAWSCLADWGTKNNANNGPHAFSELFYAYSSGTANNGTAFGGVGYAPTDTSPDPADSGKTVKVYGSTMFNWTQTFCILIGRFFEILPIMALAGALARKKAAPLHTGSFPVVGPTFCVLVAAVIIILGALNFLPGLVMGPVIEHFKMYGSHVLY
ncbi:MAG: potassium-transporting ATPase subunit KdpA [Thermoguttaceae bacterium]|jgi:K+-transporting ATPase ATPase A chain